MPRRLLDVADKEATLYMALRELTFSTAQMLAASRSEEVVTKYKIGGTTITCRSRMASKF
jgi:hypothetical protein